MPFFNSEFLSQLSATLSAGLLNGLGIEVLREGVHLATPSGSFQFVVADVCSGMRSLSIMAGCAVAYGFFIHKSALRIFLLLLLTIPLAIAANVLRIVTLCLIAHHFGQEITTRFLHEIPGLVLFYFALQFGDNLVSKACKFVARLSPCRCFR